MTKKTLIELMLENDVQWPEGGEFAVQDKESLKVCFCKRKPIRQSGSPHWHGGRFMSRGRMELPELCRNWHQTIVTREQYEAAQVKRNAVKHITDGSVPSKCIGKLHVDIQVSDIVTQIESAQRESQRHEEAMLAANERELELRGHLNEMLAKVGMKVADVEPEPAEYEAVKPNQWPDYCDENGIVVDWDKVPEGSEVSCVYNADWDFFDLGSIYRVGMDTYRDYGPIDSDGDAPCAEKLSEMEFRLIK